MNKELEEVFKRLDLFKLDMNKNIEDMYHRLYITFDDNEISYLLDYIEELQQENKELHNKIDKVIELNNQIIKDTKSFYRPTSDTIYSGDCLMDIAGQNLKILKDSDVDD